MKSQTKSCEATQAKPQTKNLAENELFEFKKCLAIQSLRKKTPMSIFYASNNYVKHKNR